MQSLRGIFLLAGIILALEFPLPAQENASALSIASARQIAAAEMELSQVKQLVSAGALPATKIAEATSRLEDARDEEVLDHTLYSTVMIQDLTGDQARQMIASATRRRDRQRAKVEQCQKLIGDGVVARGQIAGMEDELRMRETALSLAQHLAQLFEEIAASARREEAILASPGIGDSPLMERFAGSGSFNEQKQLKPLEIAFEAQFNVPLPISADGETALHRSLGFDHRGRVDVAVSPDAAQGRWLKRYLESRRIPYFAFRAAVPGQATGAHIHIGPGSTRILESSAQRGMK
jgi:hypothetical protein